jgi:hypothetical protein
MSETPRDVLNEHRKHSLRTTLRVLDPRNVVVKSFVLRSDVLSMAESMSVVMDEKGAERVAGKGPLYTDPAYTVEDCLNVMRDKLDQYESMNGRTNLDTQESKDMEDRMQRVAIHLANLAMILHYKATNP